MGFARFLPRKERRPRSNRPSAPSTKVGRLREGAERRRLRGQDGWQVERR